MRALSCAPRGARGFSLVELIVVMTIVGIVIGIAVPSYKYVTNSNRVSSEVNQLLGDMQYARSEAVKEGAPVTVCPSTNATTSSTPTCTGAATWNTGWMIFSDVQGTGQFATGDQVLRIQPGFSSSDTFTSSDPTLTYVSFNREGFTAIPSADMTSTGGLLFKLNVTPGKVQWERCLLISYVGMMQTMQGGASQCPFP